MPKLEKKILTATLYTYVRPVNSTWVRREAKKKGVSYSQFIDQMLERARWRAQEKTAKSSKAA